MGGDDQGIPVRADGHAAEAGGNNIIARPQGDFAVVRAAWIDVHAQQAIAAPTTSPVVALTDESRLPTAATLVMLRPAGMRRGVDRSSCR